VHAVAGTQTPEPPDPQEAAVTAQHTFPEHSEAKLHAPVPPPFVLPLLLPLLPKPLPPLLPLLLPKPPLLPPLLLKPPPVTPCHPHHGEPMAGLLQHSSPLVVGQSLSLEQVFWQADASLQKPSQHSWFAAVLQSVD
jgi:hypothetical protein